MRGTFNLSVQEAVAGLISVNSRPTYQVPSQPGLDSAILHSFTLYHRLASKSQQSYLRHLNSGAIVASKTKNSSLDVNSIFFRR